MDSHEHESMRSRVMISGIDYNLVLERQRGVGIYTNADRSCYLRIGSLELVARELGFHRRLLDMGFPVAKILQEGEMNGSSYWIEESLGDEHCTDRFFKDMGESGEVGDASFSVLLRQAIAMRNAQVRTSELHPYNFEALARFVGEDGMEEELPKQKNRIRAAWEKAKARIAHVPICLTHGDFTSHNIMDRGVIDFGDHFEGPLGYDLITAITVPLWFPKDRSYELFQKYNFTEEHIERYFAECGTMATPYGIFALKDLFDDLFFLKANWWAARNHRTPKLQEWRYKRFEVILDRYLADSSLEKYWRDEVRR